jgi:ESS family glutamate:Na+ symporter
MVIFVAPKLFKDAWFERAIADFGQATGVTATGLMLLRTVDPENKTIAAASFGYQQLIHEPFMGGGLWTALALPLVFTIGWLPVFIFSSIMFAAWGITALFMIRSNRNI